MDNYQHYVIPVRPSAGKAEEEFLSKFIEILHSTRSSLRSE